MAKVDIRERHFGPITVPDSGVVDVGALVRRLILFEHCTLESELFKDIGPLVEVFGTRGLTELLDSGVLNIVCDAATLASVGHAQDLQLTSARGGVLKLNEFHFATVTTPDRDQYLRYAGRNMEHLSGSRTDAQRLKRRILRSALRYPSAVVGDALAELRRTIETDSALILIAVRASLLRKTGLKADARLRVDVESLGFEGDYRVVTNLVKEFEVAPDVAHSVVEHALLAVGGLAQRLELMQSFEAMTGFRDTEAPLLEGRLRFLVEQLDPSVHEARFDRVVSIGDLPSVSAVTDRRQKISVKHLLKLRESPDCVELRQWLRTTDGMTDEEIADQLSSVRERLARMAQGGPGQAVRFLVTNGLGLVPGVGLIAGPGSSLADKFLINKVIGQPGPVSVLGDPYQSIFL